MIKSLWFLFYTECLLHWRRAQEWLYPIAFFIMVIGLFPLALTPDPIILKKFMPGCIWVSALLASLLAVETLFYADLEDHHLEQWLLSEWPLPTLLAIKLCAGWLVMALPLIVLAPSLSLIFHFSLAGFFALVISLLLGTPILIFIGSLGVTLTLGLRQAGILLSLLLIPLLIPVLIFGVTMVQQAEANLSIQGPMALLAALSLLTITLVPFAMAATLKLSMDD